MTIRIGDPRRELHPDGTVELSADVNGERLWFRIPIDRQPVLRGEPFVSCLIVPAMASGQNLIVADSLPISPAFAAGVAQLMDVLRFWGPALGLKLGRVGVEATHAPAATTRGTLSFFSGGIDGFHTMIEERRRIDSAVFVHGVDFQLASDLARAAVAQNRNWLATIGMPLLEMASNARFLARRWGVGWNSHNGLCLAGYGHALGASRIVIASGLAWMDHVPTGSHPMAEPLLSSETTTVEHHGSGPMRWQKLAAIASDPGVLTTLRVCWQDKGYNCGECFKCRMAMLLLHLLELETTTFPATPRLADATPPPASSKFEMEQYLEADRLARLKGNTAAQRMISRRIRRWQLGRTLSHLDQGVTRGLLRRLSRTTR